MTGPLLHVQGPTATVWRMIPANIVIALCSALLAALAVAIYVRSRRNR